jgi:hypothetical protein
MLNPRFRYYSPPKFFAPFFAALATLREMFFLGLFDELDLRLCLKLAVAPENSFVPHKHLGLA